MKNYHLIVRPLQGRFYCDHEPRASVALLPAPAAIIIEALRTFYSCDLGYYAGGKLVLQII
jgi:hypothetical protein